VLQCRLSIPAHLILTVPCLLLGICHGSVSTPALHSTVAPPHRYCLHAAYPSIAPTAPPLVPHHPCPHLPTTLWRQARNSYAPGRRCFLRTDMGGTVATCAPYPHTHAYHTLPRTYTPHRVFSSAALLLPPPPPHPFHENHSHSSSAHLASSPPTLPSPAPPRFHKGRHPRAWRRAHVEQTGEQANQGLGGF